jgi:hypothetical protein
MDSMDQRAAQNETHFRSVNEEIERLGQGAGPEPLYTAFVCECSDGTCAERIQLTTAEYEDVRSNSRWFVTAPGHVNLRIEHVVRTTDRYVIVEKDTPSSATIAEISDPRD